MSIMNHNYVVQRSVNDNDIDYFTRDKELFTDNISEALHLTESDATTLVTSLTMVSDFNDSDTKFTLIRRF